MKVIHLITRLIIGGAQENTLLSCEGLAERGHDVILMSGPTTGPEGSLVERAQSGGYPFELIEPLVRQISPVNDWNALGLLTRRFRELRPDVVHTHSSKAGILGRLAAARAGVPTIIHTIHGMSFNRTQGAMTRAAYAAAERYCANKCHAIVSVADAMTRQALAAGIGRQAQYETIRSGMVVADFDPARQSPETTRSTWGVWPDEIVVGTVARLFVNKGYEQLIEVMTLAAAAEPRLRFFWIGDGADCARYEAELSRRGLRDRTTITGLLPPSDMPRVLGAIDILAHCSQWEGLPRAVVQSMLMQKPAVSFDIDGAPEVVIPDRTGELVALGDHRGFAEALVRLAREPERRRMYGASGREGCLREFDHHVMVEKLDALYQRVAGRRRGG